MIRHNKQKNVGVLFEALTYSVVDNLTEKNDKLASRMFYLVKKYFMNENTELNKAYKIYSQLMYGQSRNAFYSSKLINYLVKEARSLDHGMLNSEITSLLEGIDRISNRKTVLNRKIPNYKLFASFNALVESSRDITSTEKVNCESFLSEHLCNNKTIAKLDEIKSRKQLTPDEIKLNELATIFAIKNFKKKYSTLSEDQRAALVKYFTCRSEKDFVRWAEKKVKSLNSLVEDKKNSLKSQGFSESTKLKLESVLERLNEIIGKDQISVSQFEDLILSFELKENLKRV